MSDSTAPDPRRAAKGDQKQRVTEVSEDSEATDLDPDALRTDSLGAGAMDAEAALEKIAKAEREAKEAERSANRGSTNLEPYFNKLHPFGWVALGFMATAGIATTLGSDLLIGNMPIWLWTLAAVTVVLASFPNLLHALRVAFEKISDAAGVLAKILVWAVFILQLINVVTRYTNSWFEQDILFAEIASASIHSFAFVFMLGVGYAVKDQVNPRIDFWWGEFSQVRKAKLDFVMHTFFFLPFLIVGLRVLKPFSARALGYRPSDGTWPEGWAVWRTWEGPRSAGELPIGYLKAFIFVGFLLWTIQILAEIIKTGFVLAGRDEFADLKASDVPLRIE